MRTAITSIVAAVVVFAALPVAVLGAETPSYDHVVPNDTLVYMATGNISDLKTKFEQTKYHRFWNEEEVQRFVKHIESKMRLAFEKETGETDESLPKWEELKELMQGQIAVALIAVDEVKEMVSVQALAKVPTEGPPEEQPGGQREKMTYVPSVALFLGVGEKLPEAKRIVQTLMSRPDAPKDTQYDRYKDVEITYGKIKEDNMDGVVAFAFVDTTFVLTVSRSLEKGIHKIIEAFKEPQSIHALADVPAYRQIQSKAGEGKVVEVFVNMTSVVDTIAMAKKGESIAKVLDILGLSGVKSFSMVIGLEKDAVRYWTEIRAPIAQRRGLLKLLTTQGSDFPSAKFVTPEVVEYGCMHHNLLEAYRDIMTSFQTSFPQYYGMFAGSLMMVENQLNASIEQDVLPSMGSEFAAWTVATEGLPVQVIVVELRNREAINNVIKSFIAQKTNPETGKCPIETVDFAGYKVHMMPASQQPTQIPKPGEPAPPPPAPKYMGFAVTDRYFVFSPSLDRLKTTLRLIKSPGSGLTALPEFKEAMTRSGFKLDGAVGMSFSNMQKSIDIMLSPQVQQKMQMAFMLGAPPSMRDIFKPGMLPSAETIKKYFNASVSVVFSDEDGIRIDTYIH